MKLLLEDYLAGLVSGAIKPPKYHAPKKIDVGVQSVKLTTAANEVVGLKSTPTSRTKHNIGFRKKSSGQAVPTGAY